VAKDGSSAGPAYASYDHVRRMTLTTARAMRGDVMTIYESIPPRSNPLAIHEFYFDQSVE
jgi:hypothetical protein